MNEVCEEISPPEKIRNQIIAWAKYRGYGPLSESDFRVPDKIGFDVFENEATWIMTTEGKDLPLGEEEFGDLLVAYGYWFNCLSPTRIYIYREDVTGVPGF